MVLNFFPFEMKEKEKSKVKRQMTDCIENENDQKMEREKIEQKTTIFFIDGVWYKHSALSKRGMMKNERKRSDSCSNEINGRLMI